ncbi:hmgB [Symbiodinium sp. KB8]|nr:hmgB [Symbiodinium sp. KB8]
MAQPALASEERKPAPAAHTDASVAAMTDDAIFDALVSGKIKSHNLEKALGDRSRAVTLRRRLVELQAAMAGSAELAGSAIKGLPHSDFNSAAFYDAVDGSNCENVIGYLPLPVGVVGPMCVDGKDYMVPLATTEGALVASTNRGARAISMAGGARTVLTGDGMTRAPLLRMPSLEAAAELKAWVENPENFKLVAEAFSSTSRFGRLQSLVVSTAGRNAYLRFKCSTGDAMGMNMITKGVNAALAAVVERFPTARILSLSGNVCTDKKPSAINWVDGRGKSVTAEVVLSRDIVENTLKTTADALVELNTGKNLIGSAVAGSIGGFNAHAANIVSAVFLATGQDVAQNVESSMCLTLLEHDDDPANEGGIIASVTMPSIEVGSVGGGTSLPAQSAALSMMGVKGASQDTPGANSQQLARIVAGATLAGELSLMAALTSGDLLSAHIKLNRKTAPAGVGADTPAASPAGIASFSTATAGGAAGSGRRSRSPSVHPHAGPGGGVGAFKVPTAAVAPGRRFFAAPRVTSPDLDLDGSETPRLTVP